MLYKVHEAAGWAGIPKGFPLCPPKTGENQLKGEVQKVKIMPEKKAKGHMRPEEKAIRSKLV